MKKTRKLQILIGVLLVLCVATFAVTRYEKKQEDIKTTGEIILNINSDDVTALSWEHETSSLSFHKDDNWIYDSDEAFPVNEEKIADLLSDFSEFGASFVIENVEDFGQYGLDAPACTIHIEAGEDVYDISVGNYSEMDEQRYVSIGDGNVYLVNDDPYETFNVSLNDMILNDEVPAWDDGIESISFSGQETYDISYEEGSAKAYSEEDVYYANVDGNVIVLDTDSVETYLQTVKDLSLLDFVTYNATEEEIQACGLEEPELQMTVKDSKGEEFTLSVSKDPEAKDDDEEFDAFVRIGESQIVYRVTQDAYESLMDASYNTLRHQEMVPIAFSEITEMQIELDGETYQFTAKTEDDEQVIYYNEEKVDADSFQTALASVKAKNFTNEVPESQEEIRIQFQFDNENYKELELVIYRFDGETCLAEIDGEPVAFVERAGVVDLIEAVNEIIL